MFVPTAVLRIRNVYPGSKNRNKRDGWKKVCSETFLCSHKFPKNVNYVIFHVLKKKNWANFQRIVGLLIQKIVTKISTIWVWDLDPEKTYSGSWIHGSRGQKGTGSRIRNTGPQLRDVSLYLSPLQLTLVEHVGYVKGGVQGKIFSWRKRCKKRCAKRSAKRTRKKGVNLHSKGAQVGWTGTWVYLRAAVGRGYVLDSGYHDMLICSWRNLINRWKLSTCGKIWKNKCWKLSVDDP